MVPGLERQEAKSWSPSTSAALAALDSRSSPGAFPQVATACLPLLIPFPLSFPGPQAETFVGPEGTGGPCRGFVLGCLMRAWGNLWPSRRACGQCREGLDKAFVPLSRVTNSPQFDQAFLSFGTTHIPGNSSVLSKLGQSVTQPPRPFAPPNVF